jgi:predicted DNA-binding transcriptional regulator YafY
MSQALICQAIQERRLLQFYYSGDAAGGVRIVEPHTLGYNKANNLALSAWFLGGASESQKGQGWREYLVESMSGVTILDQHFAGPRPGYVRGGGKLFRSVVCEL